ncbi:TPA: 4-(cytidine 5'-diphospho)-2-C-methyl-D-erythritol kinase [Pasteurella multocida]|uniref:4-(cytidine 5'-diphospho)-2-C-methyl-D-erythritol kinase n=1 Tax=Pasteurella multocida TaxID=747 RepID=UPI0029BD1905|nr:4-(cytidine 5'-diphospho)-2-C-methyl-D-erythritol kinase [Pasteurella multocida]HEH9623700.1 4-(cytidine 5'-diphospho)-2-C-methyl-D-erythritol kinase [Pasteurella multocida]HEH9636651.1 4-(cytidine 5'-diphospho)-2-C-methyl-D-erythritol kinase [Pasteurella multocida]HEH9638943.1 4-(cytidine 5'-diphospho)-2-C-methyl-D-erythritol kinase [Pasteurella multocida]HEH9660482.1 4-(cytidine 5'-diphospho)-2-C-methyl-D-erythritol kinase [Pasteurella multocida]
MQHYHFSHSLLAQQEKPYRFPCPAKLNLFLYINGKRQDGYHELQTLFQFVDFGDWLDIEVREDNEICLTPELPSLKNEDNLVYRAAKLLQQKTNCALGANLTLDKILPMGSGLGGGSSNAATALVALNYLWNTQLSTKQLAKLGLMLGADVPIFVHGHAAFAEGVGEKITYCEPKEKWYVVLKPNVSISTATVFSDPDLIRNTPKQSLEQLLNQKYANDCKKVVLNHYPEVEEILHRLLQYAPSRLTGTGACVFAEFNDEESAQLAFQTIPKNYFGFVAQGLNKSPLHNMLAKIS